MEKKAIIKITKKSQLTRIELIRIRGGENTGSPEIEPSLPGAVGSP